MTAREVAAERLLSPPPVGLGIACFRGMFRLEEVVHSGVGKGETTKAWVGKPNSTPPPMAALRSLWWRRYILAPCGYWYPPTSCGLY